MEKIFEWLKKKFQTKQFVFRFDYYDGTEDSLKISDTNVFQYEFINQGTTVCLINEMEVFPPVNPNGSINLILPKQITLSCYTNEKDVNIYGYRFRDDSTKNCEGQFLITEFFAQSGSCNYTLQLFIAGKAIIDPISINPSDSVADIQAEVDASILPGFPGAIVVSRPPATNDLLFSVTGITLNSGDPETFIGSLSSVSIGCPIPGNRGTLTCEVGGAVFNKLLVISKVIATVRSSKP